jgi:hypothetical protein
MITAFSFYSCEEDDTSVIDPSISSPIILNPYQSEDTVLTTSASPLINFTVAVSVNTNDGSSINNVTCTVKDPNGVLAGQFNMLDNGNPPDSNSNDSRYTGTVNLNNIECLLVGNYSIEFLAQNNSLLYSNLITSSVNVINTAVQPPVIVSTNLPDSVVRPAIDSTLLTISVTVNDPDGLCDIKDVTFVTTRPNGVVFPPIPMFNNGNGQFIFSNYVRASSDPTSYGYFKYSFTARDNSNLLSAPVTDSIKFVYP